MSVEFKLVRWLDQDRDDFTRLTSALARVREAVVRGGGDLISPIVPRGPEDASDLDRARTLLAQYAAREAAAGANADLFADPAWQMLLTLFVAREEGREIGGDALKSRCGAMPSSASRWLALIEQRGLIALTGEREGDPALLTDAGQAFLTDCLRVF